MLTSVHISIPDNIPFCQDRRSRVLLMATVWWPISDVLQDKHLIREAISVEQNHI